VKASRNGKVGFEEKAERGEDTLTAGAGVCNEEASFCRVINALRGIDELANLESGSPDGSISAGDRCIALSIIEHLVRNIGSAQAEKSKLDATDVETAGGGFVKEV
jgi:hypothetical protein